MCPECAAFTCNQRAKQRTIWQVLDVSPLVGFGQLLHNVPTATAEPAADPRLLFTCFNCSEVRESLWIVSYLVDLRAVDECLCCVDCLVRTFADPAFALEHRITLRCGGDGCHLEIDTWTKNSKLVTSLLKEHTANCPYRPVFCKNGCEAVFRRQDQLAHDSRCPRRRSEVAKWFEGEARRLEEVERCQLIVDPRQLRRQRCTPPATMKLTSSSSGSSGATTTMTTAKTATTTTTTMAMTLSPTESEAADLNQNYHESLRREALIVSRRSTVVPVSDRRHASFIADDHSTVTNSSRHSDDDATGATVKREREPGDSVVAGGRRHQGAWGGGGSRVGPDQASRRADAAVQSRATSPWAAAGVGNGTGNGSSDSGRLWTSQSQSSPPPPPPPLQQRQHQQTLSSTAAARMTLRRSCSATDDYCYEASSPSSSASASPSPWCRDGAVSAVSAASDTERPWRSACLGGSNGSTRISDDALNKLDKQHLADLEKDAVDVPVGVSYLPDVVAQKLSCEDAALRERVEKLEDVLATTRAQLEKSFAENRNLRALLASENKLRELHIGKLRDELDILKSLIFRHLRPPNNSGHRGDSFKETDSTV